MFGSKSSKPAIKPTKSTSGSIKKKAPPRPPPPKTDSVRGFESSAGDPRLVNHKLGRNQNTQCSYNITNRSDLIDLSSPTNSPPKSVHAEVMRGGSNVGIPDFKYHIGASIFYLKSELKGSASSSNTANPFSPPRPSAQSLLGTPVKTAPNLSTKYICNPTIIKPNAQSTEGHGLGQTSRNTVNDPWSVNNNGVRSQSNPISVPLEWDEPPKKITHIPPTVIRPIPPPKKPGLGSAKVQKSDIPLPSGSRPVSSWTDTSPPPMVTAGNHHFDSRPLYDEPPDSEDDDDDFLSKPMPSEPPPPPPPEILFESDDFGLGGLHLSQEQATYGGDNVNYSDSDHAYGIALYDYVSSEPGDLQFQVGDVIYLTHKVDDSWLSGCCGAVEGMFPANFVNVVVPLPDVEQANDGYALDGGTDYESNHQNINKSPEYYSISYINVLHDFEGTEANDLTLREGDVVTVLGKINEDWLYGELHGCRGQFPASFIALVPPDLSIIDLDSVGV